MATGEQISLLVLPDGQGARLVDQIDISSALPFEFEVEIRHRADLLRQLASRHGSIQLALTDSEVEVIDFNYDFGSVDIGIPDGVRYRGRHPITATAVDLVIANEIFDRIGIYIRHALLASDQPQGDNNFSVQDGALIPNFNMYEKFLICRNPFPGRRPLKLFSTLRM